MKVCFFGILLFCALASIAASILYYRRQSRRMDRMETMLDQAINGDFVAERFDESRYSSLESRMSRYLSASQTSTQNIAREKEKIKTLIADISHQTKTPIANIQLYSELMEETPLPEAASEYLSALKGQTEKLRFLIDALVKLSRLETGIIVLHPQRGSVKELIEQVRKTYWEKAEGKGLKLEVALTECCAVFDEKWTVEALGNIVDNAIKYTDRGRIRITVKQYEMFLCIEISDTGIGMEESEIPKVFSRFYRGEAVLEREGVGIGLYLARGIIAGQHGYIKVTSKKGIGSTFAIHLPLGEKI